LQKIRPRLRRNTGTILLFQAARPGLHMLRADTSPVKDRLKRLKELAFPGNVQYSACNNTKQGMEKTEGKEVPILSEAALVPSGVVRLMELQEKGWSYLRP
jgi:uncharacterized protein